MSEIIFDIIQKKGESTISGPFGHEELQQPNINTPYMREFLEETDIQKPLTLETENRLIELYYQEAIANSGEFLSGYFEHKRDIKNIVIAINAKRDGKDVSQVLVGDTDLNRQIAVSNQADFGLSRIYPFIPEIRELIEHRHLNDLEKKIDSLILDYIEEL